MHSHRFQNKSRMTLPVPNHLDCQHVATCDRNRVLRAPSDAASRAATLSLRPFGIHGQPICMTIDLVATATKKTVESTTRQVPLWRRGTSNLGGRIAALLYRHVFALNYHQRRIPVHLKQVRHLLPQMILSWACPHSRDP